VLDGAGTDEHEEEGLAANGDEDEQDRALKELSDLNRASQAQVLRNQMEIENGFALPLDSDGGRSKKQSAASRHSNFRGASLEDEHYSDDFDPATAERTKTAEESQKPAAVASHHARLSSHAPSGYNMTRKSTESLGRASKIESIIEKPPVLATMAADPATASMTELQIQQ
jgi:hypothetical protein